MPEQTTSNVFTFEDVQAISNEIASKLGSRKPEFGIILGSGLGGLGDEIEDAVYISYNGISKFPATTVVGHKGRFICGKFGGKDVLCMQGRFHCYEGHHPQMTTLPIRVMSLLGVKSLLVTNAAGGLNSSFKVGDLMMLNDHINFAGMMGSLNPLIGENEPRFGGERFVATSKAYDPVYSQVLSKCATKLGFDSILQQGVYCFLSGPCFETSAEARMLKLLGADAVGMSTVPEVIVAIHCGMRVIGMSLITNMVAMKASEEAANHEEVLETGRQRAADMVSLVREFLTTI